MPPPNILYLHSHDTGRWIQPYGFSVATPHLQQLAEEGVLFRRAFCCAPTCSASRAALLTGQSPHAAGMTGLAHRGWSLRDPGRHLACTLRNAGYHAALIGVQHEAADPRALGYAQVLDVPAPWAAQVAPAVEAFFQSPRREPFFLAVGALETHRAFPTPDPQSDPRYLHSPPPLPDCPETRADLAGFVTLAHRYDALVGRTLAALANAGLAERTLVVCTTDHGPAFPGMKCTLTDLGLGVGLILRGPGGWSGGRVLDSLVSHLDVYPTLCELAGVPRPEWLEGHSLRPLLEDPRRPIRDAVFGEVTYHAAYEPQRAVRTDRWKYIRRFEPRDKPVLVNCDDSPSKQVWATAGWPARYLAAEQLYDLWADPLECANRVSDPEAAEPLAELRARLDLWMRETNDPLLHGQVPAPRGAKVNDPDGYSPQEPVRAAE